MGAKLAHHADVVVSVINMTKATLNCPECEAYFSVIHDMDKRRYIPEYCPFCGEVIDIDDNLDEDEDPEESEDEIEWED